MIFYVRYMYLVFSRFTFLIYCNLARISISFSRIQPIASFKRENRILQQYSSAY